MDTLYIKSCLHNLSLAENNNASVTDVQTAYYKGLIVGIVSALMDTYHAYDPYAEALRIIKENIPGDSIPLNKILSSWFNG